MEAFIEFKSTENQIFFVRRDAVSAFEVVAASKHAEGHIKLFVNGFKFLVSIDQKELLTKLKGTVE